MTRPMNKGGLNHGRQGWNFEAGGYPVRPLNDP